jgi:hypothetical protein
MAAAKRNLRKVIALVPEGEPVRQEATELYRELVRIEKIRGSDESGG